MVSLEAAIMAAVLFAVALALTAAAVVASRRLGTLSDRSRSVDEALEPLSMRIPGAAARAREQLVAVSASGERAVWALARLDERSDAALVALAARRADLERQRVRMRSAHDAAQRLRDAARMVMRVIELRRMILG